MPRQETPRNLGLNSSESARAACPAQEQRKALGTSCSHKNLSTSPASSCPQRLQPVSLQGSTGGSAAKQPQNVPPMQDDPTPMWDNPTKGHNNRLIERRLEKPPGQCRD